MAQTPEPQDNVEIPVEAVIAEYGKIIASLTSQLAIERARNALLQEAVK